MKMVLLDRFSGGNDPEDWILRAERYFTYLGFSEEDWLPLPSFYLDGAALTWFTWLHRNKQFFNWRHFTEKLFIRFPQRTFTDSVSMADTSRACVDYVCHVPVAPLAPSVSPVAALRHIITSSGLEDAFTSGISQADYMLDKLPEKYPIVDSLAIVTGGDTEIATLEGLETPQIRNAKSIATDLVQEPSSLTEAQVFDEWSHKNTSAPHTHVSDECQVFDTFSHKAEQNFPELSYTFDVIENIDPIHNKNFVSEPEFCGNPSLIFGSCEVPLVIEDRKGNVLTNEDEKKSNNYAGQVFDVFSYGPGHSLVEHEVFESLWDKSDLLSFAGILMHDHISIHLPFDPGESIPQPISFECGLQQFSMLIRYAGNPLNLRTQVVNIPRIDYVASLFEKIAYPDVGVVNVFNSYLSEDEVGWSVGSLSVMLYCFVHKHLVVHYFNGATLLVGSLVDLDQSGSRRFLQMLKLLLVGLDFPFVPGSSMLPLDYRISLLSEYCRTAGIKSLNAQFMVTTMWHACLAPLFKLSNLVAACTCKQTSSKDKYVLKEIVTDDLYAAYAFKVGAPGTLTQTPVCDILVSPVMVLGSILDGDFPSVVKFHNDTRQLGDCTAIYMGLTSSFGVLNKVLQCASKQVFDSGNGHENAPLKIVEPLVDTLVHNAASVSVVSAISSTLEHGERASIFKLENSIQLNNNNTLVTRVVQSDSIVLPNAASAYTDQYILESQASGSFTVTRNKFCKTLGRGTKLAHHISQVAIQEALANFIDIFSNYDAFMVAPCELERELSIDKIILSQMVMICRCYSKGKHMVRATHMFVSMLTYPSPNRTEATLDFNIDLVGTCSVILSGAINGRACPNLALGTLARIFVEAESKINYARRHRVHFLSDVDPIASAGYIPALILETSLFPSLNLEDKVLIEDGSIVMNRSRPNTNTYITEVAIGPRSSNKTKKASHRLIWDPGPTSNK